MIYVDPATMASFSKYKQLPPEIKLGIWRLQKIPKGVHHFKMKTQPDEVDLLQTIEIKPMSTAKTDISVWRLRNKNKWVDAFSWDVHGKPEDSETSHAIWPYQTTPDGDPEEYHQPGRYKSPLAIIDTVNDIVCFKQEGFPLPRDIAPLRHDYIQLHGIKNLALQYEKHTKIGDFHMGFPFGCECHRHHPYYMPYCPATLDDWISHFRDVEKFYFLVKLDCSNVYGFPPDYPGFGRVDKTAQIFQLKEEFQGTFSFFRRYLQLPVPFL